MTRAWGVNTKSCGVVLLYLMSHHPLGAVGTAGVRKTSGWWRVQFTFHHFWVPGANVKREKSNMGARVYNTRFGSPVVARM